MLECSSNQGYLQLFKTVNSLQFKLHRTKKVEKGIMNFQRKQYTDKMSSLESARKQELREQNANKLQQDYNNYQEALAELQNQYGTMTSQIQEHLVVDKTLSAIPPEKRNGRKCFKMVGGVLMDKSVDEVIQILNEELRQLNEQKDEIERKVTQQKITMEKWMKNNNVKIVKDPSKLTSS